MNDSPKFSLSCSVTVEQKPERSVTILTHGYTPVSAPAPPLPITQSLTREDGLVSAPSGYLHGSLLLLLLLCILRAALLLLLHRHVRIRRPASGPIRPQASRHGHRNVSNIGGFRWLVIAVGLVRAYLAKGSFHGLYYSIEKPLKFFQTGAVLEILHCAIGIVPSTVVLTGFQVMSRVFLTWAVAHSVREIQNEDSVLLFVVAWTMTEIVRYSFYTFTLLNHLPYLIKWARYTLFMVLYPMGVSGELLTIHAALPYVQKTGLYSVTLPNKYNFSFSYHTFLIVTMVAYIPQNAFKNLYQAWRKGEPVDLSEKLEKTFQEVLKDSGVSSPKKYSAFAAFGFQPVGAGVPWMPSGARIGIPANFNSTLDDSAGITNRVILINGKEVDWDSGSGSTLKDALLFSPASAEVRGGQGGGSAGERRAAAVRHGGSRLPGRGPVLMRGVVNVVALGLGAVSYLLTADAVNQWLDFSSDRKAARISRDYAEGGVEFYDKILTRNKTLRTLMGQKGEEMYAPSGNLFPTSVLRMKHASYTSRREGIATALARPAPSRPVNNGPICPCDDDLISLQQRLGHYGSMSRGAALTSHRALITAPKVFQPNGKAAQVQSTQVPKGTAGRHSPDRTGPDQTRPDRTRPDQTGPDQTRPDRTRPDQTRPDQTRPDQTGPDQTGPDQTRPDRTRPALSQQEPGARESSSPDFTLSLRLYPAIVMDNDEDEDGNFTKWMSSYWGHSTGDDRAKDRRRSFRRPSLPRPPQSRRSSLPCQSQLNAMQLNHLHTGTTASLPTHVKSRNKTEVKPHLHACRASSDDSSHVKSQPLSSRIDTIHELSESLERRLCFRSRNLISLVGPAVAVRGQNGGFVAAAAAAVVVAVAPCRRCATDRSPGTPRPARRTRITAKPAGSSLCEGSADVTPPPNIPTGEVQVPEPITCAECGGDLCDLLSTHSKLNQGSSEGSFRALIMSDCLCKNTPQAVRGLKGIMGSFKGHALPGSMFLVVGLWWAGKSSFWYAARRKKSAGHLTSRASQQRLEIIEGAAILSFSVIGTLAEQFAGPWLHLYDYAEHRWDHLMNWQHATMYLFFGLAGGVSLTVHATGSAPLALDRMLLAVAFFTEDGISYNTMSPSLHWGIGVYLTRGKTAPYWPTNTTSSSNLVFPRAQYSAQDVLTIIPGDDSEFEGFEDESDEDTKDPDYTLSSEDQHRDGDDAFMHVKMTEMILTIL
ncbi:hypothetical protein SKAU_G00258280 [Synaphobranchus kaupii]|uniref:Very-long-chain (3R)-3-hydroxyacyl-CoA dehydratase n=1 Tax=Synaphobranchus kaupii TaxID=118154 RepID=A0A9Q1F471_SYNKA|nr:hypothetical protein SKAU_G00258280 [Synaphobranchus kaupii]